MYKISAEELIFSFILMEEMQAAQLLKEELFPAIKDDEFEIRLDTASNGLLAKEYVNVTNQDQGELNPNYKNTLKFMLNAKKVVRLSLIKDERETILAFYFSQGKVLSHLSILSGIGHQLKFTNDWLEEGKNFFGGSIIKDKNEGIKIEETEFDRLLKICQEGRDNSIDFIHSIFPESTFTYEISQDLVESKGLLGSIFITEFDERFNIENLNSYLVLKGRKNTWLISNDDSILEINKINLDEIFHNL